MSMSARLTTVAALICLVACGGEEGETPTVTPQPRCGEASDSSPCPGAADPPDEASPNAQASQVLSVSFGSAGGWTGQFNEAVIDATTGAYTYVSDTQPQLSAQLSAEQLARLIELCAAVDFAALPSTWTDGCRSVDDGYFYHLKVGQAETFGALQWATGCERALPHEVSALAAYAAVVTTPEAP